MESSSSNPQNEVKSDEIQLNDDKKDNNKGDTSLGESQENITDPSLEENKSSEKGEIETITNSITDGLLPTSNEINKIFYTFISRTIITNIFCTFKKTYILIQC